MDLNKFTQKSIEVIQNSQNLATEYGNPQVDEIHMHYSLINDNEGLIPRVLVFMNENVDMIKSDILREIEKLPKQQGGSIYPSRSYSKLIKEAESEMKTFGDEYVGVEHLYIALLKEKSTKSEKIFNKYNINLQRFLESL